MPREPCHVQLQLAVTNSTNLLLMHSVQGYLSSHPSIDAPSTKLLLQNSSASTNEPPSPALVHTGNRSDIQIAFYALDK
jgi:hypothetical protein